MNGWRVKLYSIAHDGAPPDWSVFDPQMAVGLQTLLGSQDQAVAEAQYLSPTAG